MIDSGKDSDAWRKVHELWDIIRALRSENGCPWDRKQTPESVQTYLIEEAHEAAAAIRSGDAPEASEELGDLLFMVLFVTYLYKQQGAFGLEDVAGGICEKMIRRHPHVFGDETVHSTQEVRDNWEKIKAVEKAAKKNGASKVPDTLPALMRAYRVLSRLARSDAHWNDREALRGEFAELARNFEEQAGSGAPVPAETIGSLLLLIANWSRLEKLRPEDCLHQVLTPLEEEPAG